MTMYDGRRQGMELCLCILQHFRQHNDTLELRVKCGLKGTEYHASLTPLLAYPSCHTLLAHMLAQQQEHQVDSRTLLCHCGA